MEDVTRLVNGNMGREVMNRLAQASKQRYPSFSYRDLDAYDYTTLHAINTRLNILHEEWTEMVRWVQDRHPNGHLGFAPTSASAGEPGVPSVLYSVTKNLITEQQRYTRYMRWVQQQSPELFIQNPGSTNDNRNPLFRGNSCAPNVNPSEYLGDSYSSENVEFWTTDQNEIAQLARGSHCNTATTQIGFVLSQQVPGTVPLYRIAYQNNLFIYTSDSNAPHHFQSRPNGKSYNVATLGYLYREWPCAASMGSASMTQVVTEPLVAAWTANDMCPLHQTLSYYSDRSSIAYGPSSSGHENLFSERYKGILMNIASLNPTISSMAASAYSRLRQGTVYCNDIPVHPWKTIGPSLDEFVASARSGQHRISISIGHDSTTTTITSNVGLHHFFGFYPMGTTVTQLPIHIHSDHFSMVFEAQGFMGIKVSPGDWMDQTFINKYSDELSRLGFIGPNGKLPLVPRIIWVALKPAVSVTLRTTEIQKLVSRFQDSKTAAISIGGIRFTSHSIQAFDDTNRGLQPDYVTLSEPKYLDIEANDLQRTDFEREMEDILDLLFTVDDTNDRLLSESGISFIWNPIYALLRQQMKDSVSLQQQQISIQTAKFQSNSDMPMIVGITSEHTESFGTIFAW